MYRENEEERITYCGELLLVLQQGLAMDGSHSDTQIQQMQQMQTQGQGQGQRHGGSHSGSHSHSHFTFENFHLDPEDYQNFLLINPPLTEYSSYFGSSSNTAATAAPVAPVAAPTPEVDLLGFDMSIGGIENLGVETVPVSGVPNTVVPTVPAATVVQQQQPQQQQQQPVYVPEETHLPTRRLSISNGQIGQISMMVHSQLQSTPTVTPGGDDSVGSVGSAPSVSNSTFGFDVDANGIPKRPLIYNNEVIFNPGGPIPGTTAWKRAKVLERNRIAASKCRAKKKNLQLKLERDVATLEEEKNIAHSMLKEMRRRVVEYCERAGVDVDEVLGEKGDEKGDEKGVKVKVEAGGEVGVEVKKEVVTAEPVKEAPVASASTSASARAGAGAGAGVPAVAIASRLDKFIKSGDL